jgi:hypothetical protein
MVADTGNARHRVTRIHTRDPCISAALSWRQDARDRNRAGRSRSRPSRHKDADGLDDAGRLLATLGFHGDARDLVAGTAPSHGDALDTRSYLEKT